MPAPPNSPQPESGACAAPGSWPESCDPGAAFDEALVADLLPDLRREWPSYMSLGDSFWAHEWLKHGTCARPVFSDEHGAPRFAVGAAGYCT